MAYGLSVWNASGVRTLSTEDRILRLHSTHSVHNHVARTVDLSVPGFRNDGNWVVVYYAPWLSFDIRYHSNLIRVVVPYGHTHPDTQTTAKIVVLRI